MVDALMDMLRKIALVLISAAAILSASQSTVMAQIQPTAEQMRMINSLPPAQREQALSAIRQAQAQSSGSSGSPPEPPG